MARLSWDTPGERFYETGVDRGVLYVDDVGFVWNGLISVQEKASGGEITPYYIDGYKYAQVVSLEEFAATIDAFSSPKEFGPCDGSKQLYRGLYVSQQPRKQFGLSYRTKLGNDIDGPDHGYKIHVVYNALAGPSDRNNATIQDSPEPTTLSWEISTIAPETDEVHRPTAHFIVDSTVSTTANLLELENLLYGTSTTAAKLPTPAELIAIFVS